uniref:Stress-induced protein 15 n=1 Tax=Capsicum annuum TaxID=4072 RepID=A0A023JGE7_CAPAN|nr:stress-induced protein 15 [Capsicum annuum]
MKPNGFCSFGFAIFRFPVGNRPPWGLPSPPNPAGSWGEGKPQNQPLPRVAIISGAAVSDGSGRGHPLWGCSSWPPGFPLCSARCWGMGRIHFPGNSLPCSPARITPLRDKAGLPAGGPSRIVVPRAQDLARGLVRFGRGTNIF